MDEERHGHAHLNGIGAFLSLAQASHLMSIKGMLLKTFGSVLESKTNAGCAPAHVGCADAAGIRGLLLLYTIRAERSISWPCVDLSKGEDDASTSMWWDENEGSEIVARGQVVNVARLVTRAYSPPSGLVQLVPRPGVLSANLVAEHINLERPPLNTLLLEVCSVGLNFRDVLNVLGAYPGDPGPPGSDVSGIVMC